MSQTHKQSPPDDARRQDFRKAWSRFATGVTLITTTEPGGGVHAMTANGVTSVSLTPPLILACIGYERNTYGFIRANGRFGISILDAGQGDIARHYALPPERRGRADGHEFVHLNGASVLAGALAAMDCTVVAAHEAGDHTIFVAEVGRFQVRDGRPLIWYAGQYGDLAPRDHPPGAPAPGRVQ